jgi:hypothetical protein
MSHFSHKHMPLKRASWPVDKKFSALTRLNRLVCGIRGEHDDGAVEDSPVGRGGN